MFTPAVSKSNTGCRPRVVDEVSLNHRAGTLILKLSLAFLAVLVSAHSASAQVLYSWINPAGGNYGSAVNWFPGAGAPPDTPLDGAEFGPATTYTVDFFSDFTVGDAYVAAGDVTWHFHPLIGETLTYNAVGAVEVTGASTKLTVNGGEVTTNSLLISGGADVVFLGEDRNDAANITITGTGSSLTHGIAPNLNFLEVADTRPETLTIENGGTVLSFSGHIGVDLFSGSAGVVDVIGPGSTWTTTSHLEVGDTSPGTLNISDGGMVMTSNVSHGSIAVDADGTANVTGSGSAWMIGGNLLLGIGEGFTGTLNITGGGTVSNTVGRIASDNGSGSVTVSGPGSTWTNSGVLYVGYDSGMSGSTGELTIEAGGIVTNTNGVIGNFGEFFNFPAAVGTVTVTGTGSTWTNSGNLTVGLEGIGTLNIENGGDVSNNVGYVADAPGSEGGVTVTGAGSTWTNSGDLTVGLEGLATLNIENGGDVANTVGYIAYAPDSEGGVTVSGAGSTWTNNGLLQIGRQGDGTLTITDGGEVNSVIAEVGGSNVQEPNTGTGTVTVSGIDSTWTSSGNIHIGYRNSGMLTVQDGGNVSNLNGFIARFEGSSGFATVTGAGSTWTNSDSLNIGNLGDGSLIIEDGGAVTNTDGHIAPSAGSLGGVIVRGAGSTWNMSGPLFIGSQGSGTLTVENGGSVSSHSGNLGAAGGSSPGSGTATVTGPGSTWNNNAELHVGNDGSGVLNVQNGGAVSNATAYIATTSGSSGFVLVSGHDAMWSVNGRLSLAGDVGAMTNGGNGTLVIETGGTVTTSGDTVIFDNGKVLFLGGTFTTTAISFQGGGQFQWNAGTLHVGTYNGNLENPDGVLAPGESAGTTTVLGNYTQGEAGQLEIEIGGTAQGTTYDVVNIGGTAFLDGELQLAMLNGFQPAGAEAFVVLNSSGILSGFSNVANGERLATIDDLGSFQVNYGPGSAFNPSQVVLSNFIPNALPGDFNSDGTVDAADYVVWRKTNGMSNAYNTWRTNFGRTAGGGSASNATIPEPAASILIALGAALGLGRTTLASVVRSKGAPPKQKTFTVR